MTRRTKWCVGLAAGLAGLSLALAAGRSFVLGETITGPRGAQTWRVDVVVRGQLRDNQGSVRLALPPDFRHQHIFEERFAGRGLLHQPPPATDGGPREGVWRPANPAGDGGAFRIQASFSCTAPLTPPTPAMEGMTRRIDAPPRGAYLAPGPGIESDAPEVRDAARGLNGDPDEQPLDRLWTLFDYVYALDREPALKSISALECLREGAGDSRGKSRLLVALCRARRIPARLVSGLILTDDREQGIHYWAEAYAEGRWVPMCPTLGHFDTDRFPANYLVLSVGDRGPVQAVGGSYRVGCWTHELSAAGAAPRLFDGAPLWRFLSFYGLRPAEQQLIKFLLLLPLGGLIVSFFRTAVGLPTFGTFTPALLGLSFLDTRTLVWGVPIFFAVVLAGWAFRHVLDRLHLLQVPRTALLLSFIVLLLLAVIFAAGQLGVLVTQFVGLLPLVILTHIVERFWTVEVEDGPAEAFKTFLGTLAVAFVVCVCLSPDAVAGWLFRYPETLGLVFAAQLLLGRYTGYRLSELYRFRELLDQPQPAGEGRR